MTLPDPLNLGPLENRPVIVALAGPNGAGKTTFYYAHLRNSGLRFVNADRLAKDLGLEPYSAARLAAGIRDELFRQRESFVFETVFSDPVGEKLEFLNKASASGYSIVLCFIGIEGPALSMERVAMRVSQGGHDVPDQKIAERFPRIHDNLKRALRTLPLVWVFDNSDLRRPHRLAAIVQSGSIVKLPQPVPDWLQPLLP